MSRTMPDLELSAEVARLRALISGPLAEVEPGSRAHTPNLVRSGVVDGWTKVARGRWDKDMGGDKSGAELVDRGARLTHVPVDVATLTALLDAAEAMGLGSRAVVEWLREQRAEINRLDTDLAVAQTALSMIANWPHRTPPAVTVIEMAELAATALGKGHHNA